MPERPDDQFKGENLTCVRGARMVFRDLGFEIPAGGALLLTGPNGSGKSSLLRLMAGLGAPAKGGLTWNGEAIAEDREAHGARVHYVGHATGAKAALTAREDLAFWSRLRGVDDDDAIDRALDAFGLSAREHFPVRFLSSGQKRRLALARLLAAPAPLWLLDEPTVGLDTDGQAALERAIAGHRAGGGLIAVASHTPITLGDGHISLDVHDFTPSSGDIAEAEAVA